MKFSRHDPGAGQAQAVETGKNPSHGEVGWFLGVSLGCQLVLLLVAAWFYRNALNPDAVAYLQLGRHYAEGNMNLAVSGHWSPLISWMLAAFLKVGLPPLIAARMYMVLSGLVFLLGAAWLFRQMQIGRPMYMLGIWLMALLSIPWSVENITPDLMLGGIVSAAFAEMVTLRWLDRPICAVASGCLWAFAFFCKAVALPLGILVTGVMVFAWWKSGVRPGRIWRAAALTLLGMSLALGWIGILSVHYGKFTVTTSAAYNHALVGPAVAKPLFLLDQGFRVPPPGRITVWEDPTSAYPDWSPWSSLANTGHQLQIMVHNLPVAIFMVTSVSLVFPLLLVAACVVWRRHGIAAEVTQGTWALIPVLLLLCLFLPNYLLAAEQRYFYCAAPLLFVASVVFLRFWSPLRNGIFALLLAAAFLIPTLARSVTYLDSTRMAGGCARVLAQKIEARGLAGPIVGSGKLPGGRAGLYAAYLLGQPWYGDEPNPSATDYQSSHARLMIVDRGSPLAREFSSLESVLDLDAELFAPGENPEEFPLQVFENTTNQ